MSSVFKIFLKKIFAGVTVRDKSLFSFFVSPQIFCAGFIGFGFDFNSLKS